MKMNDILLLVIKSLIFILFLPSSSFAQFAPVQTGASLVVTASSLMCRSGPDRSAPVVERLARLTPVVVSQVQGEWVRISRPSTSTCWVMREFLTAQGSAGTNSTGSGPLSGAPVSIVPAGSRMTQAGARSTQITNVRIEAPRVVRPRSHTTRQGARSTGQCPCGSSRVCVGPRGGRYCITNSGGRRYGV